MIKLYYNFHLAPSILPKYIWNFKHVDVGVVRDSEPKLTVHGLYEPEEDSLRLLPGDTWIDAGDCRGIERRGIPGKIRRQLIPTVVMFPEGG